MTLMTDRPRGNYDTHDRHTKRVTMTLMTDMADKSRGN